MFGYIRVFKDELKVREYNMFRAYYCGLCKTLKKEYGMVARIGLSYDLSFFSLIMSSLSENEEEIYTQACIVSPVKKKPIAKRNDYMVYAAGVNVILMYFKLLDDIRDSHITKSLFVFPFVLPAVRKAKKRLPQIFEETKKSMKRLSELEKTKCSSPDTLADEFGTALKTVFSSEMIKDENTLRIFEQLGYLLGRFIYLLDVCDDVEKDKKNGSFNVLLSPDCYTSRNDLLDSLEFTLSEIAAAYNLLEIKKNKPILDNIIYLGLRKSLSDVRCPKKEGEN